MARKKRGTPKPSKAFEGSGQTPAASNKQPSQPVIDGISISQGTSAIPGGFYTRASDITKKIQDTVAELVADVDNTNRTGYRVKHPKAKGMKSTRNKKRPTNIYPGGWTRKVIITGLPSPIPFFKPVDHHSTVSDFIHHLRTQDMQTKIHLDALARDRENTGRPITRKLTEGNKNELFVALV